MLYYVKYDDDVDDVKQHTKLYRTLLSYKSSATTQQRTGWECVWVSVKKIMKEEKRDNKSASNKNWQN